ncbi:hypothetical protein FHX37_0059 [Haloactinospora alba]|uniref:Uncharacterized protein n=1 Tax=Haloactinospora alba TaxID=405555 RepID=A0A543NEB9_9ACTN|nr:hypothetical protein [Haloactinospora alba]TQN30198.1 hypothetical protein FHX37_0059 [Haloactinospora alba]
MTAMAPEPETEPPRGGVGSVSGGADTVLTDPRAPTHTGEGPQINAVLPTEELRDYLGDVLSRNTGRDHVPGRVTAEHLRRVRCCFVPPPGYAEALSVLSASRLLFLSGRPGSGRRGSALRALQEVGPPSPSVRELPDGDEQPYLHAQRVAAEESLLLDVSAHGGDALLGEVQNELAAYRDEVNARFGHLVVVLAPEQERLLRDDLRFSLRRIHPPDKREVLRRHLSHLDVPFPDGELDGEQVRSWLHSAGTGETAELADLVRRAEREGAGEGSFRAWLDEAQHALADWDREVAEQVERFTTSRQRAVLFSAAMLHGLPVERVFTAAEGLLHRVSAPDDECPVLERRGFSAQLHELGARVDGERRVSFADLDYDAAVRNRFWDDFPDLRDSFGNWVSEFLRKHRLPDDERSCLVTRLAELYLRSRQVDSLFTVVERWARQDTAGRGARGGARQALELLRLMLEDERSAWETRRRLREWAADRDLSPALAEVLLVVCERVLVRTHPEQAIVRMHHLARNGTERVSGEAARALVELARGSPERRRMLFARLAERLTAERAGKPEGVRNSDVALVWRVGSPEVVAADGRLPRPKEHDLVVAATTSAMAADTEGARHHTERWLDACARDQRLDAQLSALAAAARGAGCAATVYTTARRWVLAGGDRAERSTRRRSALQLVGWLNGRGPAARTRDEGHRREAREESVT